MLKQIRQSVHKREKWDTIRNLSSPRWILSKYSPNVIAKNNKTHHNISSISVNSILIRQNVLSVDKCGDLNAIFAGVFFKPALSETICRPLTHNSLLGSHVQLAHLVLINSAARC